MTCSEKREPKGSASSSTERKKCGRCGQPIKADPISNTWFHTVAARMPCTSPTPEDPECQHADKQHTGSLYDGPGGRKSWLYYTCPDCKLKWREEEAEEPPVLNLDPTCKCHHPLTQHTETGCVSCRMNGIDLLANHSFIGPEEPSVQSDYLKCRCGHFQMHHRPSTRGGCHAFRCACDSFKLAPEREEPRCEGCGHTEGEGCGCPPQCACGCARGAHMGKPQGCTAHGFHEYEQVPEPPLTPEEEEQAPEDEPRCTCGETACESELCDCDSVPCPVDHAREASEATDAAICGNCYTDHAQGSCEPVEPPPQPDRRPPYAVSYSVQGHLFEVALPGDASVRAVDGALVIQHHLGPVLGIVQVLPVINEDQG